MLLHRACTQTRDLTLLLTMLAILGVACSGRSDRRIRFRQRLHLNRSEHKFLLADKQNEGLLCRPPSITACSPPLPWAARS